MIQTARLVVVSLVGGFAEELRRDPRSAMAALLAVPLALTGLGMLWGAVAVYEIVAGEQDRA